MKSFIKDNGSLVKQNDNKVKVYHSLADAETALANGEIAEGEVITTEFVDGATDIAESNNLISDAIALLNDRVDQLEGGESGLNDKISSSATSTNKCPSASEVSTSITSAINTEVTNRNNAISTAINALDAPDSAVANQYVSAVSETDGVITVSRANMPTFTLSGTDLIITA